MYVNRQSLLHVLGKASRLSAARRLSDISSNYTLDMLQNCWIDNNIGPSDIFIHDASRNFISEEFHKLEKGMGSTTNEASIKGHQFLGIVERYHSPLPRAYKIIFSELFGIGVNKNDKL